MAINYTRLFTTLGKVVGGLNEVNAYRGTTLGARTDTLSARFDAALQFVAEGLYPARDDGRTALDGWVQYLQQLARDTIVAEVIDDRPLVSPDTTSCILELDRQMKVDAQSLEDSDAAVVVTPSLVDGDALLIGTALQPATNLPSQLALPDSYLVSVPNGFLRGDIQFQEILDIKGTAAADPATNHDWPAGSGIETSLAVRDPHNNLGLQNGRLSSVTGWTQTGGTWAAVAATTPPRTGYTANVTRFTPSGASGTLTQAVTTQARTIYAWTFKVFKDAGTQDWTVGIRLKDGAGTTIGSLSSSFTAASLSAGWNTKAGFWVTPAAWDGQASLELFYSAIVTQTNLEVAHAGLIAPVALYPGGPTLVAFAALAPLTQNDKWTVDVTIGGTGALHRGIDRLVDIKSVLSEGLPTSVTATQADALVS